MIFTTSFGRLFIVATLLSSSVAATAQDVKTTPENVFDMARPLTNSPSAADKEQDKGLHQAILSLNHNDTQDHITSNIAILENAIKQHGLSGKYAGYAMYDLGYAQYNAGKIKEALQAFDAVVALPDDGNKLMLVAHNMRMQCYIALDQPAKAISAARATESSPGLANFRAQVASRAYIMQAQLQKTLPVSSGGGSAAAAATYAAFIKDADANPFADWKEQEPYVMRGLGAALVDAGRPHEGAKAYKEFLRRYPKNYDASLVAMERMAALRGGIQNVRVDDFNEICNKYPTDTGAGQVVLYQYAMAYVKKDNYPKAIQLFTRVYNYVRKDTDAEFYSEDIPMAGRGIALAYEEMGDKKNKLKAAKDVVTRYPKSQAAVDLIKYQSQWIAEDHIRHKSETKLILIRLTPFLITGLLGAGLLWRRRRLMTQPSPVHSAQVSE